MTKQTSPKKIVAASTTPPRGTTDVHVRAFEPLDAPEAILQEMPLTAAVANTVLTGRDELRRALAGLDPRLVVICGPCSIHDPVAALDYAQRLSSLRRELAERLLIVMRVYFEKPRTTVGWKGLINDPELDGTHKINQGLRLARRLLLDINALGLPCGTEFLDPIVPQYTADLIAWSAIGARTTESQTHREMASGLSMPVGFKNATDGNLQIAMDAMISARHPHTFLGIGLAGRSCIVRTTGNPDVHIVLRGGGGKPNCSKADIAYSRVLLEDSGTARPILVDCSHGNSGKDPHRQPAVCDRIVELWRQGERALLGVMLESNLVEGAQKLAPKEQLVYGQSITDACLSWPDTATLLRRMAG